MSVTEYWSELVTTALLGTDRRQPPAPPAGPLQAVAADDSVTRPDPAQAMLRAVAALTVARRAGVLGGPPAVLTAAPDDDALPTMSPAATESWRQMVADWPVLEDEFQVAMLHAGVRPGPDLLVAMLGRHRGDAIRHARVMLLGGPLARWLVDLRPHLAARANAQPSPEAIAALPDLPISVDLQALLAAAPGDVAAAVRAGLDGGQLTIAHRGVLVNLLARVAPASLLPTAEALDRVDPSRSTIGLAFALADLCRLRHRLLVHVASTSELTS